MKIIKTIKKHRVSTKLSRKYPERAFYKYFIVWFLPECVGEVKVDDLQEFYVLASLFALFILFWHLPALAGLVECKICINEN